MSVLYKYVDLRYRILGQSICPEYINGYTLTNMEHLNKHVYRYKYEENEGSN
jgi:hypothetical protein